jgi:hypothetical protein
MHNGRSVAVQAPPEETHTALDALIRSHLVREGNGVAPASTLLRDVLQRAQTEIEQLPPEQPQAVLVVEPAEADRPQRTVGAPVSALMHFHPPPEPRRISLRETIAEYRQLMDLKMFRIVGSSVSTLSMNR